MVRIRKELPEESFELKKRIVWRIAVYIRLSREDGKDESLSVSNQRKIILEYVEENFQEEDIIEDIYIDDGQSGTDYDRPEFQRMLCDVERGKVNCIVCKNLSRAFRNYSDQGYFLESYFPKFHTRFVTLGDPKVDTFTDPEVVSGMEVPISGLMNDRFACKTSNDIRRTFDTKRRRGEFIGAFAPYGYLKDPEDKNHLIIDPDAAEVVRDIFCWYVYGDMKMEKEKEERFRGNMSKEGIARRLNDLGIPNPTAYKRRQGLKYCNPQIEKNDGLWQGASVAAVLSNEMYTGTMVQGKQRVVSYKVHDRERVPKGEWYRVRNTHEAIITEEMFALAQKMQARERRRAPGKRCNYLFSGFLKCADCHKSMTRKPSRNIVYFNCSTYKRKSKNKCTIHSIRLDVLEKTVLTVIQRQIELAGCVDETISRITKWPVAGIEKSRLQTLLFMRPRELKKSEDLLAESYLDWKNGTLTLEQYSKIKGKLEEQENRLKIVLKNIKEDLKSERQKNICGNIDLEYFLRHGNIFSLSQGILTELVEEILVHENGGITIVFCFKNPYS